MPYVTGYAKVRVWVPGPPGLPDFPVDPGWGVDEGGEPAQPLPPRPGLPERPGQGLPWPGYPGRPGQGLPWPGRPADPGWGIEEFPPGIGGGPVIPGYPGQPLPRPPRPVYPVVDDPEDLGGHPAVPDLNMTHRIVITDGTDQFTGYVLDPEPPQVEDDYEPRPPTRGLPGTWVAVLYGSALAWAWVRTPGTIPEPGEPEARSFAR